MVNKKGNTVASWPEMLMFLVLIAGFVIAVNTKSVLASYTLVCLAGALFGRFAYAGRKKPKVPMFMLFFGFLIGFLLGALYGDLRLYVFFFLVGIAVSYWLHKNG